MSTGTAVSARATLDDHLRRQPQEWAALGLRGTETLLRAADEMLKDSEASPAAEFPAFRKRVAEFLQAGEELAGRIRQFAEDLADKARELTPREVDDQRHDLVNALNTVGLYCQSLHRQARALLRESYLDDLERIQACWTEAVAGVNRLIRFSRPATGKVIPVPAVVAPATPAPAAAPQPDPILIVDDSLHTRTLLAELLASQGYPTDQARDGEEGLRKVKSSPVALILLDLRLPGKDGLQVLRELKADSDLRHVPVLVMSNLDDLDSAARCIEQGAEDYLPKPINQVLLRARINACLEKRRLRDQELKQFFPDELARLVATRRELLAGQKRDVTLLFCDIRGFSAITENRDPSETVEWVSDVMGRLSDCVLAHRGVLVDYIGDELLAMWGAPEAQPGAQSLACAAARDMVLQLPGLNRDWKARLGRAMDFGIGIHTGPAHVGNVGSHRKFKYGPLGDTVNRASRVQGATKHLHTRILLTGETRHRLDPDVRVRRVGKVRVVNIQGAIELYELMVSQDGESPERLEGLKDQYEQALAAFEGKDFLEAARILGSLRAEFPKDGPARQLLLRAVDLDEKELPGFDGVWQLETK